MPPESSPPSPEKPNLLVVDQVSAGGVAFCTGPGGTEVALISVGKDER